MMLPASYQELERIYQSLSQTCASCVAFTSAEPGEGVSLVVDAIARRAASVGKRVLVVDLNLFHPRITAQADWHQGEPPETLTLEKGIEAIPAPSDKETLLTLREPGALERLIEQWKLEHELILLDCVAVNLTNQMNLPVARCLKAADGVITCYLAGRTAGLKLKQACEEITAQGALLTGVVVNDRFNPALKSELLRSLPKMLRLVPMFSRWLCRKIAHSQLLSIKI